MKISSCTATHKTLTRPFSFLFGFLIYDLKENAILVFKKLKRFCILHKKHQYLKVNQKQHAGEAYKISLLIDDRVVISLLFFASLLDGIF